jgi:tRNA threonylcarbamoyladenosine biosynthesis protein TsaB
VLCLAFDTCTTQGRFALARAGEILAYQPFNISGNYADALLPVMDDLLAAADCRLEEIDVLALATGPGSFTGLRIGVATAKGIAYALGSRLLGVSSLEAMAAAMLQDHREREWAVPVLDARRGELFAGLYRRRGEWVEAVEAPAARAADAWWRRLVAALSDPELPAYGGNGSALLLNDGEALRPELQSCGEPVLRAWNADHPATARALAWAGSLEMLQDAVVSPFALRPLYLRASDAEVKRGLDLTPEVSDGGAVPLEDRRPEPDGGP